MGVKERIIEVLRREGPLKSREISQRTGIPLNSVYVQTSILVFGGKIRHYKNLQGVFEAIPEEVK